MQRVRHCARKGMFLLMILSAVGPLALLQVVAWTGMLWNYSRDQGIAVAVVDTFSGEKPCDLCLTIQEMRESTPMDSVTTTWGVNGLLLPLQWQPTLLVPPLQGVALVVEPVHDMGKQSEEVLLPPPIQGLS